VRLHQYDWWYCCSAQGFKNLMAIHALPLTSLEKLIQQALALDPFALNALQKHTGKSVYIECTDPAIGIVICINELGVSLANFSDQHTDSHLKGELAAYIELLSAQDKVSTLINGNLRLKGDTQWLLDIQKILQDLNLDWEFQLAKLIGDLPAHWLGKLSRDAFSWISSTRPIFWRHLQEFIQEESKLAPNNTEIEQFIDQVQQLHEQAERLEARLKQVTQHSFFSRPS